MGYCSIIFGPFGQTVMVKIVRTTFECQEQLPGVRGVTKAVRSIEAILSCGIGDMKACEFINKIPK
jgi:hypothetical protein